MEMKSKRIARALGAAIALSLALTLSSCDAKKAPAPAASPEVAAACKSFPKKGRIDELLAAKLESQNLAPAEVCTDEVFLRRAFLDAIGTLPTPEEAASFLDDKAAGKRDKLVDSLLQRREFAVYWAMKWGDTLRIKAEFPSNLWPNAAKVYAGWVRDCIRKDMPYNEFVQALLTSNGSNFHKPPVNFYRAFQERDPKRIAENAALVFMGVRLDTPSFSDKQRLAFSAFFSKIAFKKTDEWKEEIVYFNPSLKFPADPESKAPVEPVALDGTKPQIAEGQDPRTVFAAWLTSPQNPWFAKNAVNRVWASLMGRGLIEEVDDIRPDNPPWSPELLAYLEKELVDGGYDLKRIYALILKSSSYQMSSVPSKLNNSPDAPFTRSKLRRLEAEVLVDAVCQVTGSIEKYSSGIPEPFTFLPDGTRAIEIEDGSISSPILELFGRPSRNSSLAAERSNASSVLQAQCLLNSNSVQRKIERGGPIKKIAESKKSSSAMAEELYLLILSRRPQSEERSAAVAYMDSSARKQRDAAFDLAWALLNSKEFILKR